MNNKEKLKRIVGVALAKDLAQFRQSAQWLQEAIPYNHALRIPDEQKELVCALFETLSIRGYKPEQKLVDLEILIANLNDQTRRPVSVSLDTHSWTPTQYRRANKFTLELIKLLHQNQLIQMKTGYNTQDNKRLTRIWATPALLEYCIPLSNGIIWVPEELVELRSNGELKEYKNTAETYRIRSILERVNTVNATSDFVYGRWLLKPSLVAIFKDRFTLYGRMHTRGYRHVQNLSKNERADLRINGKPVVELDYRGMHPNLLYTKQGIQYQGDPYSVVHPDPVARPFLKHILLCLLNSKTEIQAERAANNYLRSNKNERADLLDIGISRARPLIDAFKDAHGPIAPYFSAGGVTGLKIMNLDSKIALGVLDHFARQGIAIVSVHDSFIVQRQFAPELKETMHREYSKKTGGFTIEIR